MGWKFDSIHTIDDLSLLSEDSFRTFLSDLFQIMNYVVKAPSEDEDHGADFIMTKLGIKTVVRGRQGSEAAGLDVVKEVHFAKDFYKADQAWAISPHGFTVEVSSAARSTGVRLVDGLALLQMIEVYADAIASLQQPVEAEAQDEQPAQTEVNKRLFSISGDERDELCQYHGKDQDVIIPEDLGIRRIGLHAFSDPGPAWNLLEGFTKPICDSKGIRSVVIPEGVVVIGCAAFEGCTGLEAVTLPSTLRYIAPDAFRDCSSLRDLTLPDAVCKIGARAFYGCWRLRDIRIPENVKTIEAYTFSSCTMLTRISLPDGLKVIEERAFQGCRWLERVELPASIERLASLAFKACERLTEVSVTGEGCCGTFPRSAFLGCPVLDEAVPIGNLPSTATLVNDAAFPGMFEGPPHELRVLKFDAHILGSWGQHKTEYLVVDRGACGLNRFSGGTVGNAGVGFWVELDDGCKRGYYALRGTYDAHKPGALHEGYLEQNDYEYSSLDPSRRSFDGLAGTFFLYLWNCHLMARPGVDGARAACLVDTYREEVAPLVEEFQNAKRDTSGRGKKFEQNKLAVLDGIHAKIRSTNNRFKRDAGSLGLDCGYYIGLFSATVGEEPSPSSNVVKAETAKRLKRAETRNEVLGKLLSGCVNGCIVIVSIVLGIMGLLGWLLILMILI